MDEETLELEELYEWLDGIKLSRVKRNIARDFSDGVLLAELLKSFYPRLVDIHNYSPANSLTSKLSNWSTLNKKVLTKLDLTISSDKISAIATCTPRVIEEVLKNVKRTVENRHERKLYGSNAHLSFFGDVVNETSASIGSNIEHEIDVWRKQAQVLLRDNEKLKTQLEEKDEVIDILQKKVTHLGSLLELKDAQLQDMTKQLNRYQEQSYLSNKSQSLKSSSSNCPRC